MKKLSEMVYEKEFKVVKGIFGGESGYEKQHVDFFLEEIGPYAEEIERQNEELLQRVRELEEELLSRQAMSEYEEKDASEETKLEDFEKVIGQDEALKRRMRQMEVIEKSYRKILFAAEEEAEEIRNVAKQEAKKMLLETQQKSELLLKQVNVRCEQREKEYEELLDKKEIIDKELYKIADFIMNRKPQQNEQV